MTPPPLPAGPLVRGYLQPVPGEDATPNPGVTYLLPAHGGAALPLPGQCLLVGAGEAGGAAIYRLELPHEVNSVGMTVWAKTVVYLRVSGPWAMNAQAGHHYPAGHALLLPGPVGGELTLVARIGGPAGIPAWETGDPVACADHPGAEGYGYPLPDSPNMARVVALRFLDPYVIGLAASPARRRLL